MNADKNKMKTLIDIDEQVVLCHPNLLHAEDLFEAIEENRKYMEEWIPWTQKTKSVMDARKFVKEVCQFNVGGQKFNTMIYFKNQFSGMLALHRIDKVHRRAEIGYWLKSNAQGFGIIRRALPKFVNHAFNKLKVNRIDLIVATTNTKSVATAENAGFIKEGMLKQYFIVNNVIHDAFIFRLLKDDVV